MKVLLTQDVIKLGRIGDVVEVKPGYARNYLIPQGLAMLATDGALKQAENLRRTAEKIRARELGDAQALANQFARLKLQFERKVGPEGRLYGSVTTADIAELATSMLELEEELDKRKLLLNEPIRRLGNYDVEVRLHPDVTGHLKVEVIGDEGERAEDFIEETEGPLSEPETLEEAEAQPLADY
jgi:large subunit ribosomal protein L9